MKWVSVIRAKRSISGLYATGLFLANRNHVWTPAERRAFEKRDRELRSKR